MKIFVDPTTGATTYQRETTDVAPSMDALDNARPYISIGLMKQLRDQADGHGVVSEIAMLDWMKGQGFLPGGDRNHNDASREGFLAMCNEKNIEPVMQQLRDNAKKAVLENWISEITVPSVPSVCQAVRSK